MLEVLLTNFVPLSKPISCQKQKLIVTYSHGLEQVFLCHVADTSINFDSSLVHGIAVPLVIG